MAKKVHGEKHVHDKMMPGEHRKHANHAAMNAGLKDGLRLHQGYARSGKAPTSGKPTKQMVDE